jgi:dCTP deaminase
MILSNVEILRAIDEKRLVIKPEPTPRSPSPGVDCPYQASSVDLTLGDEISWLKPGLPLTIDLRGGGFARLFSGNSDKLKITNHQPYILKRNEFVLGKTHEWIELPIMEHGQGLAARVEGRSSYARCGVLVHFTAPTIHAGYEGHITLELCNLGPASINLYPRMPICQLILEAVSGVPFRNDSQFHGQKDPGGGQRRRPRRAGRVTQRRASSGRLSG